jgi:hypothetical protein
MSNRANWIYSRYLGLLGRGNLHNFKLSEMTDISGVR